MKHWVFDLDGTLVDSSPAYEKAIEIIFSNFGLICSADDLQKAHLYFNPYEFFSLYLKEKQVVAAIDMLLQLNLDHADKITEFSGISELIENLYNKNVKLSVWTGRDYFSARKILDHLGLSKYIDQCVSRTCVTNTKPLPDGLLKILKDSAGHPSHTVMVGDHQYDILGARAASVKAVSVSWKSSAVSDLVKISDHHFYQVADLKTWALNHY